MRSRGIRVFAALAGAGLMGGCGGDGSPAGPQAPTWSGEIAPLVHRSCAPCHRPGEPAPFPLLAYEDAFRKRRQMAKVTRRRLMPPWLPSHGDFAGDRRLTDAEIDLISRWVAAGAPRGDAAREPDPPVFPEGWQLREPDLVVTAPEPVSVTAGGPDQFRNLVIPVGVDSLRYVEAVEIRPGSAAVHHAILRVDSTRDSRRRDAEDPEPGFPGMWMGLSRAPDGHFLGWTPGKRPHRNAEGLAWRLRPGDDLVLQLHLTPTGKPERVRPRIGLYFTDAPATVHPYALVMYSEDIDIAPGDADFVLRDEITLPVAVEVHAVYPHAHYLCETMQAGAVLPDGSARPLLGIDRWDFDWQDDYRYREPVALPAGTRLWFEYRYDNSADNPDNPYDPPRRVRYGLQSTDEMGTLTLTLVTPDAGDRPALLLAAARRDVERKPGDPPLWLELATELRGQGRMQDAADAIRRASELQPGYAAAYRELGILHKLAGSPDRAEPLLAEAVAADPEDSVARMHLGELLARSGRTAEAIEQFEVAVRYHPNHAALHNNLATALFIAGELERAAHHYERATTLDRDHFNAWLNRGRVLSLLGRADEARAALEQARRLDPGDPVLVEALRALSR